MASSSVSPATKREAARRANLQRVTSWRAQRALERERRMALSMDLLRDGDVKAGVRRERRVEGECIERQPGPSRLETKLMRPTVGIVDQAIQTRHVHPHAGLVTSQVGVLGEVILGKRLVVFRQLGLHGVDAAEGDGERVWR